MYYPKNKGYTVDSSPASKEYEYLGKSKKVSQPPKAYVKNKAEGGVAIPEGRSSEELLNEAIELYQRGVSGDGKSVQKTVDLFAHLRKALVWPTFLIYNLLTYLKM